MRFLKTIFASLILAVFAFAQTAQAAPFFYTQTSNTDFNGTNNQTSVANNSVAISLNSPTYSLTQTNDDSPYDDTTTPKPTYLTGSFKNRGDSPFTASGMSNTTTTGSGAGTSVGLTPNPSWIAGYCGIKVYNVDVSDGAQWKIDWTNCRGPECATGLDPNLPSNYALIDSNGSNIFASYPARKACYDIGGRLPTRTELLCIYTNRANFGSFHSINTDKYWSSVEIDTNSAWTVYFATGAAVTDYKPYTDSNYVRCVRDSAPYNSSGTYTSYVDSGNAISQIWNTFQMTKGSTAGGAGTIAIKIKASTDKDNPPTFNATGAACDFSVSADGSSGSKDLTTCTNLGSGRYLWYQATLSTADTANSPLLQDVTVGVTNTSYYSTGTYTSGYLDGQRAGVLWDYLSWQTTQQTNTSIVLYAKTSPNQTAPSFAGCNALATVSLGSGNSNGTASLIGNNCVGNDRYLYYQAVLSTPSPYATTPTLDQIDVGYGFRDASLTGILKFIGSVVFQ